MTAYSPFGSDKAPVLENRVIKEIAQRNGVDPAQVLVSWAVQRDTIVIPKSVNEKRILSNFETFTLQKEDFDALNELEAKEGTKDTTTPHSTILMSSCAKNAALLLTPIII